MKRLMITQTLHLTLQTPSGTFYYHKVYMLSVAYIVLLIATLYYYYFYFFALFTLIFGP